MGGDILGILMSDFHQEKEAPMVNKKLVSAACVALVGSAAWLFSGTATTAKNEKPDGSDSTASRVQKGLEIAPVPLNLEGKSRAQVGMGSYLVNAVGLCADCHSCPTYTPGQNPYQGGDGSINPANYLAGGVAFGPFISANLTPDASGNPAGFTREEFIRTIRTGHDAHDDHLLFVMPWPILRNMNDRDLSAIYTYLSSIPHAEPGTCGGAGE